MFKQKIEDGYQKEVPDNWLKIANPFEIRRDSQRQEVRFGGYTRCETDEHGNPRYIQEGYQAVVAVPYDLPVIGYGNGVVNTLRIWSAEPVEELDLESFDQGEYEKANEQNNLAEKHPVLIRKYYKMLSDWEMTLDRPMWMLERKYEKRVLEQFYEQEEYRHPKEYK